MRIGLCAETRPIILKKMADSGPQKRQAGRRKQACMLGRVSGRRTGRQACWQTGSWRWTGEQAGKQAGTGVG